MTEEKKMVTLRKLSEIYGISLWTLRTWATWRFIPIRKLGRKIYVVPEEFEKWIEENTENYSFYGKWKFKDKEQKQEPQEPKPLGIADLTVEEHLEEAVRKCLEQSGLYRSESQVYSLTQHLKNILIGYTQDS